MLPQLIPLGLALCIPGGADSVQGAAEQELCLQPLCHACWQGAVLPALRVGCLQKEKQNPCQKRSFQLSPLSTALLESRIGLGCPLNVLHKEKNFCISSLHPSEVFQVAFSPVPPPSRVSVGFYQWLCWPSQLLQEVQPGWALCSPAPVLAEGDSLWPQGEAGALGTRGGLWLVPLTACSPPGFQGAVLGLWCCAGLISAAVSPRGAGQCAEPHHVLTAVKPPWPIPQGCSRLSFGSGGSHGCPPPWLELV